MLFQDLIRNINYKGVWEVLDQEYHHKPGAHEAYQRILEELQALQAQSNKKVITIVVARVEDVSNPGTFIYEVFGMKEGDQDRYGLEMTPWDEWLNFYVLNKSIEIYGAVTVVAHTLYEMTFFGYSAGEVAKRVDEEKQILTERLEEIEAGNTKWMTGEELRESLGITDKRTAEEREQRKRQVEKVHAENEKVYKELLSNWKQK